MVGYFFLIFVVVVVGGWVVKTNTIFLNFWLSSCSYVKSINSQWIFATFLPMSYSSAVLPALKIMGWRVTSWVRNPLGECMCNLPIIFSFWLLSVSSALFVAFLCCYWHYCGKNNCFQGNDSSLDDCIYHLICPCCTLCQVLFSAKPLSTELDNLACNMDPLLLTYPKKKIYIYIYIYSKSKSNIRIEL